MWDGDRGGVVGMTGAGCVCVWGGGELIVVWATPFATP